MATVTIFDFLQIGGPSGDPDGMRIDQLDGLMLIGRRVVEVYDDVILPSAELGLYYDMWATNETILELQALVSNWVLMWPECDVEIDMSARLELYQFLYGENR